MGITRGQSKILKSVQEIANLSFDTDFNVSAVEMLGYESSGQTMERVATDSDGHLQVDILSGGTSGTEYTEDAATANPQVGKAIMVERDDALTAVTPVEGDWIGLRGTAEGALWTQDFNSDALLADTNAMVVDLAAMEALLITIDADTSTIASDTTSIDADTTTIIGHVDGIETLLGTIDADTGAIKTAVEIIDNAISGSEMQVDVVASLPVGTNAIGKVGHDIADIGDGVKTVTTAGTDEALAGSTACKRVTIQAQTDNTGWIAVGTSGVDATEATGTGVLLAAGDVYELEIDNLADVYIDSTVNGEGVRFAYFA